MYNYKFDDEVSTKVASSYENSLQNEEVVNIVNKIKSLIDKFGFVDIQSNGKSNINKPFVGKNIFLNNIDAFNDDQIEFYSKVDKNFTDTIDAIQFEIISLKKQKQKAITDFNIAQAVKLNDKINTLDIKLADNHAEINTYNNQIADIEQDYRCKYEKLISELKSKEIDFNNIQELESVYGQEIIGDYKRNSFIDEVVEIFKDLDKNKISQIIENKQVKEILGPYYYALIAKLDYVGTDN